MFDQVSLEREIAAFTILGVFLFVVYLSIRWLIRGPHQEMQSNFETLTERNQR